MELLFEYKTHRTLGGRILRNIPDNCKQIYAAIAYNQDGLLVETCISKSIKLNWWCLFDSKSSTSYELAKKAIESELIRFYPLPQYFHPKVIYFENYGLYIGSANMTRNGLYNNVEAGVFIPADEIEGEMQNKINDFFNFLEDQSILATMDDIDLINNFLDASKFAYEDIDRLHSQIDENFEECLSHLFVLKPGARDFGRSTGDGESKRKRHFLQEWRETQNYIEKMKNTMLEQCKQPSWINKNANPTIITDQLLHAYYYSYILGDSKEGKSIEKVITSYEKNKHDPMKAVLEAIRWWETIDKPPNDEDVHINEWSITNQKILNKLKNTNLELEDFVTVFEQNHAARNHARQIKNEVFNLEPDYHTDIDERTQIFAEWLFKQKTAKNLNIHDVLRYILFDNEVMLEERIYNAVYDEKFKIEHLGRSIIGELVGWGRPDITYLRNNRVNKALRCLGFDVKLFSE